MTQPNEYVVHKVRQHFENLGNSKDEVILKEWYRWQEALVSCLRMQVESVQKSLDNYDRVTESLSQEHGD